VGLSPSRWRRLRRETLITRHQPGTDGPARRHQPPVALGEAQHPRSARLALHRRWTLGAGRRRERLLTAYAAAEAPPSSTM
jgi:hypothetical protein